MFDILLMVHLIIAALLITVVLLQKTSSDGLGSLGGGGNSGFVTARTAANFMTKLTIFLAAAFFINSIILANLSTKRHTSIIDKIEAEEKKSETSLPVAQ
jgi:preprotein translocase subunit SecG